MEMNVFERLYTLKVECQIEAMKAENKMREIRGESLAYGEAAFSQMADEIQEAMETIRDDYKQMERKQKYNERRKPGDKPLD